MRRRQPSHFLQKRKILLARFQLDLNLFQGMFQLFIGKRVVELIADDLVSLIVPVSAVAPPLPQVAEEASRLVNMVFCVFGNLQHFSRRLYIDLQVGVEHPLAENNGGYMSLACCPEADYQSLLSWGQGCLIRVFND